MPEDPIAEDPIAEDGAQAADQAASDQTVANAEVDEEVAADSADDAEDEEKKRLSWTVVWRESRDLLWARRRRLILGFALLLISRLTGMVLPATTKVLIDQVIGQQRADLLPMIALVAGSATIVQSVTSFFLGLILGVTAQRSINDLRLKVQQHVARLPVSYFEDHKTGELISRVMNDAEGIRNLVGNGFVQLLGGIVTSTLLTLFVVPAVYGWLGGKTQEVEV